MLDFIRRRAQTWIAWVIVGFIILVFASWGISEYFTGDSDTSVALVNGEKISEREFQMAYYQQRERMKQMLGENFDISMFEDQMRKNVLDGLVEQELMVQVSNDEGFRIGDEQLVAVIQEIEAFQKDGKFDKASYTQALQAQGQSPGYFESRVRRSLLAQQLYSGISESALVTPYTVDMLLKLKNQERDISYFEIPSSRFISEIKVDDEQVSDYYSTNMAQYMTPEKVSINYLELSAAELANEVDVTDEALKAYYDDQRDALAEPEERRASHILIEVSPDASADDLAEAKSEAEDVLKQVKAGGSFADLAKANSDDPGSADFGGDLGFFKRGDMVPEFDEVAFNMLVGDVSDLVKTDFGYHIIKLDDIKEKQIPSFDEMKADLSEQLRMRESERLFFERSEILANMSYEFPDALLPAAEKIGLTVKSTESFSRGGGVGIAANPKVSEAAFKADTLKEGLNSEIIEIGDNHVVVLRVKEHTPEQQRSLDEVRADITNRLTQEAATQRAESLAEEITVAFEKGESAEALAKKYALEWKPLGPVKRDYRQVSPNIVQTAFSMTHPEAGKANYSSVATTAESYAVVALNAVNEVDVASLTDQDREAMKRELQAAEGNSEYAEFSKSLRESANIVVKLAE